jgi:hypothetical protein
MVGPLHDIDPEPGFDVTKGRSRPGREPPTSVKRAIAPWGS